MCKIDKTEILTRFNLMLGRGFLFFGLGRDEPVFALSRSVFYHRGKRDFSFCNREAPSTGSGQAPRSNLL